MGKNKPIIGLIVGILLAVGIHLMPLAGLSAAGKMCLALTFMTVAFWGFQIAQPGFTAGLYLALLVVFNVAPVSVIFAPWSGPIMYLVIGAYLIAGAVKSSGLGERIAYNFILKFVDSYRSIIISTFLLTFILSVLIPHPWPRAFLIMSVMAVIVKNADIPQEDAVKIGFTVFAASVPVSLIFLTGDSVLNVLAVQATGKAIGWIDWFIYMGPPNIIASILTCILILFLFKPSKEVSLNKEEIQKKLASMGSMKPLEVRTAIWIFLAIIFWMTDSIHGIHLGWVTLIIAMGMALPAVGGILTPKDWSEVPIHILLFLTAAITIGTVGGVTGMNAWIAQTILPSTVPGNIYILAAFIATVSIAIHMALGSVIAVMGIAIPALLLFTQPIGINPIVTVFLVYTAVGIHYILPFQQLSMLIGQGEENGMYTQKEVIRLGIPLTVVVYIMCVCVLIPYWKMIGLL
ncbi:MULTISPECIES: SLC13 family permease [Sporomusa]|uniref:SLC13 family permease n=1 Tax=Sporomusa TaxID=2375 RepID=UPI0031584E8A